MITFYVSPDQTVWATSVDDHGPYAVAQIEGRGDFDWILSEGRIQARFTVDPMFITNPEDLMAVPFAWLYFEDDSVRLVVDRNATEANPAASRFLFHKSLDAVTVQV